MNAREVGHLWCAVCLLLTVGIVGGMMHPARGAEFPSGKGQQMADLGGFTLSVFTWRPDGCAMSALLVVFAGLERNAADYRDDAIPLGQRLCMLVVAPLFDATRFPTSRYQRGGIVEHGAALPAGDRTVDLVPRLIAWARAQLGRPNLPCELLGHSAGAQFLARVGAFAATDATRIVIADPSTWVWPSFDIAAPYGFGGAYRQAEGEAELRHYLAAPMTVLLGEQDTGSRNLVMNDEAEAQGATRFERGQNVFRAARRAANEHGWAFNWRLAVVPGVGHDARRIFASDEALAALRP